MWREEVKAEGEVGAREDGEGFDEDVGGCFIAGEVGIELVAVRLTLGSVLVSLCCLRVQRRILGVDQIELIKLASGTGD